MKRILIVGVVLALAALIPALALGSGPKQGYYEAVAKSGGMPFGSVIAKTKDGDIADLSAQCPSKKQADTILGFEVKKNISVHGSKFKLNGKAKLTAIDGSATHKKISGKGKFTKHFKKWKGQFTVKGCKPVTFKGKYAGTQIGG
jgi:hypothetical protein